MLATEEEVTVSRWGELIPHDEDNENCLCGCRDEVPAEEECLAAAEETLRRGFTMTTVVGEEPASARPGVVSGPR
ncbi:hypothetical protein [Streptomyces sp. NRRL S-813]|uniref:hypothetical protein n=1 Tax=Streptomyces sp. NRRL S-813 TaxID=1463919 RepID=UPI0004BF897B|nr:hypothetical protein [Streptomyces sp. NRRL S-813]